MNSIVKSTATVTRLGLRSRFQTSTLPAVRHYSGMPHTVPKLKDPSLLKTNVAYVNGEWVGAQSGKTFEVTGMNFPP